MLARNRWRAARRSALSHIRNKSSRTEAGATLVEYALLLALLAVLAVGSLVLIGHTVSNKVDNVAVDIASEGGSAPAVELVLSAPTANQISAGSNESFTATIEDASGIPVTSGTYANSQVTFSQTGGSGSVTNTGTVLAVAGLATIVVTGNKAGGVTLQASAPLSNGTDNSNSVSFTVVPGNGNSLEFNPDPGAGVDGQALTGQPTVTVLDAQNNIATGYVGSVTLSIASQPVGIQATLLNCTANPLAVSSGEAAFTNCAIIGPAGAYTLNATSGTLNTVSTSFNISAGTAEQLVFSTDPGATAQAGQTFSPQPAVSIEDQYGDVVTNDTHNVTLTIESGTGTPGASLTCTAPSVAAQAGIASFAGCLINTAGLNYVLEANDPADGTSPAYSTAVTITAGAPTKLLFSTEPGGAVAGSLLSPQPVVTVEDAQGNVVTGDANSVALTIATETPAGSGSLSCTHTTVAFLHGVATFAGCKISNAAGTYTLQAADGGDTLTQVSTAFGISGTATQIAFSAQPTSGAVAVNFPTQPVVAVEDALGNPVTSDSTGTVTLSLNNFFGHGPGALTCTGSTLTAAVENGYATFTGCSISGAGNYELHATISVPGIAAITGAQFTIVGTPTQLAFSTQPGTCGFITCTAAVGSPFNPQPQVAVEDANGNVVTTDAGDTVTLTLNLGLAGHGTGSLSCTGTPTATVVGGYATFTGCSITTAGNYQLTATDSVHTIAAVNSNRLTVQGASQLAFTAQPSADPSEAAGVAFTTQPVVAEEDANGDVVTSDSGNTVTLSLANFFGHGPGALTCTGNATLKATVTAGYATFSGCSISAGGNYEIHAADSAGGIAATTGQEFLVTGAPAKLAFSTQPGTCGFITCTAAVGSPFNPQPQVAVEDANGNVVTTDAGDKVTLTLNNGLAGHGPGSLNCTGTTTATVAGGYATFTGCSITTAGNYQLTATDSVVTIAAVNSNRLTIQGATQLAFTKQPSQDVNEVMGVAFTTQPVVAEEDANGDVVTSDSGNTVTLSLATFFGHGPGALTCTGNASLKATVTAGYATFSGCSISAGGNYEIHAVDSAATIAATTGQEFGVAGAATQLAFTTQPVGGAPGQAFTQNPAVSIEDANGNVETTDSSTMVTLSISAGGAISCIANPAQAQNGLVTFTGCSINNAGFYTLTATDVTNGHITAAQTFLIIL